MVGHIAETGQVIACDFRPGNASPARENLEFIQQCEQSLPDECFIQSLRIDAAGYQEEIIKHCDRRSINYAIRAKMNAAVKEQIDSLTDADWQPLLNKQGKEVENQDACRIIHWIGKYEKPFTLIIQRTQIKGQSELDLGDDNTSEEVCSGNYIYRAIATNRSDWSNSHIIHWYNQRGEGSENRIKEL